MCHEEKTLAVVLPGASFWSVEATKFDDELIGNGNGWPWDAVALSLPTWWLRRAPVVLNTGHQVKKGTDKY